MSESTAKCAKCISLKIFLSTLLQWIAFQPGSAHVSSTVVFYLNGWLWTRSFESKVKVHFQIDNNCCIVFRFYVKNILLFRCSWSPWGEHCNSWITSIQNNAATFIILNMLLTKWSSTFVWKASFESHPLKQKNDYRIDVCTIGLTCTCTPLFYYT